MSSASITMSEFVKEFKVSKTEEEKAVAILDIIKQSQSQTKEETLKEIASQDFTTKADIHELKADVHILKTDVHILKTDVNLLKVDIYELKTDLAEIKTSLIKWVSGIILLGVWAPVIVALIVKYIA